jgi:hypothetical protein
MKRARTRAYANIRTGGLLAIERKFSDLALTEQAIPLAGGSGAATLGLSDYAPPLSVPGVYRSAIGTITFPLPAAFTALNILGTGDSGSDRDGRQVINDSIHLRGQCSFGNTSAGTNDASGVVNIVLVLDTQTNGTGPTGGLVFVNPGDINAGSVRYPAGSAPFVNLSNSKRFRILKHIRRVFAPTAMSTTYPSGSFLWSMDVPLKGMKTNYVSDNAILGNGVANAATVASVGDNGLFLFVWTDNQTAGPVYSWNCRLRFRG